MEAEGFLSFIWNPTSHEVLFRKRLRFHALLTSQFTDIRKDDEEPSSPISLGTASSGKSGKSSTLEYSDHSKRLRRYIATGWKTQRGVLLIPIFRPYHTKRSAVEPRGWGVVRSEINCYRKSGSRGNPSREDK